jgi:hypothetical protein
MYEQGIIHPPTTFQGILVLPVLLRLADDKAVRSIMGITQEAIRSTRYRILTPKGMSVALQSAEWEVRSNNKSMILQ